MEIVKFSDCKHTLDPTGILTIFVNNNILLKFSPMDLLKISRDVMQQTFKAMSIPDSVSDMIPTTLTEEQEIEDNTRVCNNLETDYKNSKKILTSAKREDNLEVDDGATQFESLKKEKHKLDFVKNEGADESFNKLLEFVKTYINDNSPSNVFYIEELKDFVSKQTPIENVVTFLKINGYLVTAKTKTLIVSQGACKWGSLQESEKKS